MTKTTFIGAAIAACVAVAACSDDHDNGDQHAGTSGSSGGHTSPYPSCNAIIQACHQLDVGEGPIHECHELGSSTSDALCAAGKDRCINTVCVADAGGDDAGGSFDAASE